MPRLGCGRIKAATERMSRGNYRLTVPRIGYGRVKASTARLSRVSYRMTVLSGEIYVVIITL